MLIQWKKEIGLIVDICLVILSLYKYKSDKSCQRYSKQRTIPTLFLSTFCASVPIISMRKIRNHLQGMAVIVFLTQEFNKSSFYTWYCKTKAHDLVVPSGRVKLD